MNWAEEKGVARRVGGGMRGKRGGGGGGGKVEKKKKSHLCTRGTSEDPVVSKGVSVLSA